MNVFSPFNIHFTLNRYSVPIVLNQKRQMMTSFLYKAKATFRFSQLCVLLFVLAGCAKASERLAVSVNNFDADKQLAVKIEAMIRDNHLPGLVLAIMHRNQLVIHQAYGYADREHKTPMRKDHIFRLFSMTKPITALATLKLMDERGFGLDTPLQHFFPSFDQQTDMPMHTLLNHTSGLSYGFKINRIAGWKYLFSGIGGSESLEEFIDILSGLPLLSEPGVRWRYSFASDVQGAVIEKLTDTSLNHYLKNELFAPLNMTDTGFFVEPWQLHRVVPSYSNSWLFDEPNRQALETELTDNNALNSGGGGLLSTAGDYMKFLQLLIKPEDYEPIIDPKWVKLMQTNQLADGIQGVPERLYTNSGFGYGLGVKLKNETYLSQGSVYWAGKGGTVFWVDKEKELAVVAMMQMEGGNRDLEKNLVPMVYEWLNKK